MGVGDWYRVGGGGEGRASPAFRAGAGVDGRALSVCGCVRERRRAGGG